MKYKETLEKQIKILEELQDENVDSDMNASARAETAVKIAEEINCLVAHAKVIIEVV